MKCCLALPRLVLAALPLLFSASALYARPAMVNLFVSSSGDDAWCGRAAVRKGKNGPFATLERAREAIRALKAAGKMPPGGVTVWLRGGIYERAATFALGAQDGGTASAPIVYRAYRGEAPRLVGGREVRRFSPVTDRAVLERLDPAARGKVLQAALRAQGVTDFGRLTPRGFGRPTTPAALELLFADRPMPLARWPNAGGWATIADVPDGPEGGRFTYAGDRPRRWKAAEDIWLHGYWTWDWADSYERVRAIDTEKREIATEPPHGAFGYTKGKRYYALNLLEELDTPGEWYLDRKTGILYFWPPAPPSTGTAFVSVLSGPLVTLRDASYVTLRGLTLECGRGAGVTVTGGAHCLIAGCTLRNLGTAGVIVEGGERHGVASCDIYDVGEQGVSLSGGDRKTLTPCGHYAENDHIYHYSRWVTTYRPGVGVDGVGVRVAHNHIHDAPHNAILLGGNDHVIEYNEIDHVCKETGDAGAFYMGRDWTMRGTVLRYNYFHDLRGVQGQAGFTDVMAVYLDDCASGTTVYGNVFVRAGRAAFIGGGRDNTIENNLFVDCAPAIHVDARALGWAKAYAAPGGEWEMEKKLVAVRFDQPPYSVRYPRLARILQDDPAVPKGNRIVRNVIVGRGIEMQDGLTDQVITLKDNWTEGDPGLIVGGGDSVPHLRRDSPVYARGFKPIPVEKIGLRRTADRPPKKR